MVIFLFIKSLKIKYMTENSMKSKVRAKIIEIQYLALLCEEIGYYCFTNYSPHVNQFEVRLHSVEKSYTKGEIRTEFYVKGNEYSIEKCNNVIYQLKSLLKKKTVDYSKLYKEERIEIDYVF